MVRSGSSTTTKTINFDDAPKLNKPIVLKLGHSSLWDRFKESVKGLSPEAIIKRLSDETERIMKNIDKRGYVTDEECAFLNNTTEERLKEMFEIARKQIMAVVKIQPGDKPEEIKVKLSVSEELLTWLKNLFDWVIQKIKLIFTRLKEAAQWCWTKAKELFHYLYSLLNS